jgi:hypothetical protein
MNNIDLLIQRSLELVTRNTLLFIPSAQKLLIIDGRTVNEHLQAVTRLDAFLEVCDLYREHDAYVFALGDVFVACGREIALCFGVGRGFEDAEGVSIYLIDGRIRGVLHDSFVACALELGIVAQISFF